MRLTKQITVSLRRQNGQAASPYQQITIEAGTNIQEQYSDDRFDYFKVKSGHYAGKYFRLFKDLITRLCR